ncbi:hypothetical protein KCU78_g5959, partial [Aureobasidium melanogenum]
AWRQRQDERDAEQERRHQQALAQAAAEHDRILRNAIEAAKTEVLKQERERKQKEEEERRVLEAERSAKVAREAAEEGRARTTRAGAAETRGRGKRYMHLAQNQRRWNKADASMVKQEQGAVVAVALIAKTFAAVSLVRLAESWMLNQLAGWMLNTGCWMIWRYPVRVSGACRLRDDSLGQSWPSEPGFVAAEQEVPNIFGGQMIISAGVHTDTLLKNTSRSWNVRVEDTLSLLLTKRLSAIIKSFFSMV